MEMKYKSSADAYSDDQKGSKKIFKTNGLKQFTDEREKTCINFSDYLQSNKIMDSSATALIPPWLRNSLGVGISYSPSEGKPNQPLQNVYKGQSQQKTPSKKSDSTAKSEKMENDISNLGLLGIGVNVNRESDKVIRSEDVAIESKEMLEKNKIIKEKGLLNGSNNVTSIDFVMALDQETLAEDEKKRLKLHKQKPKVKKRSPERNEKVGLMLEKKAKEVLEAYLRKDIQLLTSDACTSSKAKGNYNEIKPRSLDDIRLVQDSKEVITNKEDLSKWVENLKENNIAGLIIKNPQDVSKFILENCRFEGGKSEKISRTTSPTHREDAKEVLAHEEENEIKKIHELLSKTRTSSEKHRYLEQLKKHFEKKKQTQMVRHLQQLDDVKSRKRRRNDAEVERETYPKEKIQLLIESLGSPEEHKVNGKCHIDGNHNNEIFEKAIANALKKFAEYYGLEMTNEFVEEINANIMNAITGEDREKNIQKKANEKISLLLEIDNQENKKDLQISHLKNNGKDLDSKFASISKSPFRNSLRHCYFATGENISTKNGINIQKNSEPSRKNPFKTKIENKNRKSEAPEKEMDVIQNEEMENLKNDFNQCLELIQTQMDIKVARLHSVIFENSDLKSSSAGKIKVIHYHSMPGKSPTITQFRDSYSDTYLEHPCKSEESQTENSLGASQLNMTIQTDEPFKETKNTGVQTHGRTNVKMQTECLSLTSGNQSNPRPGLYWLVLSKEKGRFFLLPEKLEMDSNIKDRSFSPETCKESSNEKTSKGEYPQVEGEEIGEKKKINNNTFSLSEREAKLSKRCNKKTQKHTKKESLGFNVSHKETRGTSPCLRFKGETLLPVELLVGSNKPELVNNEQVPGEDDSRLISVSSESGCNMIWKGENMDNSSDLKAQVEDLVLEKLRELIVSCKTGNMKKKFKVYDKLPNGERSQINEQASNTQDIKETDLKTEAFHFPNNINSNDEPFIFKAEEKMSSSQMVANKCNERINLANHAGEKSFREIGTQNSRHTVLSFSVNRPKAKMYAIANIKKRKWKKRKSSTEMKRKTSTDSVKPTVSRKKVHGENFKIELANFGDFEGDSSNSMLNNISKGSTSTGNSSSECTINFPTKRNGESTKKDEKRKTESRFTLLKNENGKLEVVRKEESDRLPGEVHSRKSWKFIESFINRFSNREQEKLWSEVREYIKERVGKDLGRDKAREFCIEIVQDISMPHKDMTGSDSAYIIEKGNQTHSERDFELEVDLTLEDLEKLLRHRRRKWKKNPKGNRSKKTFSSPTHHNQGVIQEVFKHPAYLSCSQSVDGQCFMVTDL